MLWVHPKYFDFKDNRRKGRDLALPSFVLIGKLSGNRDPVASARLHPFGRDFPSANNLPWFRSDGKVVGVKASGFPVEDGAIEKPPFVDCFHSIPSGDERSAPRSRLDESNPAAEDIGLRELLGDDGSVARRQTVHRLEEFMHRLSRKPTCEDQGKGESATGTARGET